MSGFALPGPFAEAAQGPASSPAARPLRIIMPYPPGGLADIFARSLAAAAAAPLAQQFVIENRPGATQIIGAQAAARATPDGHTLFFGSVTSLAINPASRANLPGG